MKRIKMIKTNFLVTKEEKDRILNLHESATKKLYLVTEAVDMDISEPTGTDDLNNKVTDIERGSEFVRKSIENPNMQDWMTENEKNYPRFIRFLRDEETTVVGYRGAVTDRIYRKIGRYLRKNPEVEKEIEDYSLKNPKPKIRIK
jgi:hypothetical protein